MGARVKRGRGKRDAGNGRYQAKKQGSPPQFRLEGRYLLGDEYLFDRLAPEFLRMSHPFITTVVRDRTRRDEADLEEAETEEQADAA